MWRSTNGPSIEAEIQELFRRAGADGAVHVRDVDGDRELGVAADRVVVAASVFKVPVLLELARQVAAGTIDPTERVVVPTTSRCPGPTGISGMLDPVELSLRDLAYLMMTVSDNAATDAVIERIGIDRVAHTLAGLGLKQTVLAESCAAVLTGLAVDLGLTGLDDNSIDVIPALDPALLDRARALVPTQTNRTTPREMTTLLTLVWRDQAGSPEACAEVRRLMALQVWPHRLTAGFPDEVAVAGKTGTLPGIRNEAGVVTYPDGGRYAVAVFTRAHRYSSRQPAVDAAIGQAARLCVEALRSGGAPTPRATTSDHQRSGPP